MRAQTATARFVNADADDPIFRLDKRGDGVAVLYFSMPGARQNTITTGFGAQFAAMLERIGGDTEITGLVIVSDKPRSFLAGADIGTIDQIETAAQIEAMSRQAQDCFRRVAKLHVPVVAAIDGSCLGGGLELALACDIRVAADTLSTALGVPEVQLGLLPAAGGTQRLPRLIGIQAALDLMLTGRSLRPGKASKMGLIDEVVEPEALLGEAIRLARARTKRRHTRPMSLIRRLRQQVGNGTAGLTAAALENNFAGRRVLFDQARKQTRAKTHGHYPAADKIIDVIATGYAMGLNAGYTAEARAFAELATGEVSKALRHVYHASQALKKETFVAKNVKARPIARVGVLGAGLMGAGVTTVTIDKAGLPVRLKDVKNDALAEGIARVDAYYSKRIARGAVRAGEANRCLHQLTATTDYSGLGACDLVVEAVFEDLELKRAMLADVEAAADARGHTDCIFASNTSSLPIADIAANAKRPENVIGMHYFSPVEKMPLLEIIATDKTAKKTIATAVALGKKQGKTVIVVADGPGFYTTRVLSPYLNEAARVLGEGAGVRAIDDALVAAGFPVGPMTLLDETGIDVGEKVGPILERAFGERMAAPGASEQMIAAGYLGRKSGKGFYDYTGKRKNGKRPVNAKLQRVLPNPRYGSRAPAAAEIAERCTLLFANEVAHCLSEGIIGEPMYADIGAIFGLGFPPFTGGPCRYIDAMGAARFVERMNALAEQHGPRFMPAPIVKRMAAAKASGKALFYS